MSGYVYSCVASLRMSEEQLLIPRDGLFDTMEVTTSMPSCTILWKENLLQCFIYKFVQGGWNDSMAKWRGDMSCMILFRGEARTQNETLWKVQVGLDQICVHVVELMFIGILYSAMQDEYGSSGLATTWVLKFTRVLWGSITLLTSDLMLNAWVWSANLHSLDIFLVRLHGHIHNCSVQVHSSV